MSKIRTALRLLMTPRRIVVALAGNGFFRWMEDERYLKMVSRFDSGARIDLNNPRTFTEKIHWLKLHDHQKRYIEMVDKLLAKEYVGKLIGEEYIIPTLGVWENADSIQPDTLPSKFVLKCNHDSGSVVICRDKSSFDFSAAKRELNKHLKKDAFSWGREWPYKNISRKVFAEELLECADNPEADVLDYKFFCFGGKPTYCQVISERTTSEKIDFFDLEWNHQPFVGLTPAVKNSNKQIPRPASFSRMVELAGVLSLGMAFCRVDFYDIDGKLYFGEITLYPNAGYGEFIPPEWNSKLGELIDLSPLMEARPLIDDP